MPITEIGFQSELFGLIVVRTIIGHSPGLGGGLPKQRCSSCFGFKNSKNKHILAFIETGVTFWVVKNFLDFFRVNRIISLFDIRSS